MHGVFALQASIISQALTLPHTPLELRVESHEAAVVRMRRSGVGEHGMPRNMPRAALVCLDCRSAKRYQVARTKELRCGIGRWHLRKYRKRFGMSLCRPGLPSKARAWSAQLHSYLSWPLRRIYAAAHSRVATSAILDPRAREGINTAQK